MSDAKQETVADIVGDIRAQNQGLPEDSYALSPLVCDLLSLADRIEAAHQREVAELKSKMNDVVCENEALRDACETCGAKREREATREKSSQVGNAAKMREALRGLLEIVCIDCKSSYEIDGKCVKCPRVVAAEAALSAPPLCNYYEREKKGEVK